MKTTIIDFLAIEGKDESVANQFGDLYAVRKDRICSNFEAY
jgi:hypothetical protein